MMSRAAADHPSEHRCSILVVDDDRDAQEMVRMALMADGYAVAVANSGRDAIDHLRSHDSTCAILLDLMLPEMSGAQFRQIQLRDRSLAWIPVIVMSAALDADAAARHLRAHALIKKPVDLDELRHALAAVIGRGGATASKCSRACGP